MTKHHQLIKDWVARTHLNPGVKSGAPEGQAFPVPVVIANMIDSNIIQMESNV